MLLISDITTYVVIFQKLFEMASPAGKNKMINNNKVLCKMSNKKLGLC